VRYAYFPGCSLKGSASEYDLSCRAVSAVLGVDLMEVPDWNCCGATDAVYACNPTLAISLSARNLALAGGMEIVTLCSACFSTLSRTRKLLQGDPRLKERVDEVLREAGLELETLPRVRHYLDILINEVGIERIRQFVRVPLKGLRVASYYGCLLVRPPHIEGFDDREHPTSMDSIVEALGGKGVHFTDKTRCCGASLALADEGVMMEMTKGILLNAKEAGADCVVTPCPMCHFNLDAKQRDIESRFGVRIGLPILYITQLIGLAFGIEPKRLGLERNIVSPRDLLQKLLPLRVTP
jgi:heterodisulfide reductase subunit B